MYVYMYICTDVYIYVYIYIYTYIKPQAKTDATSKFQLFYKQTEKNHTNKCRFFTGVNTLPYKITDLS